VSCGWPWWPENPAYRNDKRGATLEALPDLFNGRRGAHLVDEADGFFIEGPQALLVSNDAYEASDLAGMGRRARLDRGSLGLIAVRVDSGRQAAGLLRGTRGRGVFRGSAREVVVRSPEPDIPVGIDGETVRLPTPVRCINRPRALRVRLPRDRPGIRPPQGQLDWTSLWSFARGRPQAPLSSLAYTRRCGPLGAGPRAEGLDS
jgi:hypothetical protein